MVARRSLGGEGRKTEMEMYEGARLKAQTDRDYVKGQDHVEKKTRSESQQGSKKAKRRSDRIVITEMLCGVPCWGVLAACAPDSATYAALADHYQWDQLGMLVVFCGHLHVLPCPGWSCSRCGDKGGP